jgi:DNA-binding transcriptional MerR regulator
MLRHYDEIGLLLPAWVEANGYRYYDYEQLARLQQILLLRELDLGLEAIAGILDGEYDRLEVLRCHHQQLLAERDRLATLAQTVAKTITHLERGTIMPAEELFEGFAFTPQMLARFEAEAIQAQDERATHVFDEIKQRTQDWTPRDYQSVQRNSVEIERRLLELLRAGVAANDARVLDVLDADYAEHNRLWSPTRADYAKLGQAYVDHPELRAHFDSQHPDLAAYLRDAMAAYAQVRLT